MVFLIDSSGSVGEANFNLMKGFLKQILEDINIQNCNYRIGALKFGSSPFVQFHLNQYQNNADLMNAIDNIGYSYGFTATSDALKVVRQEMFVKSRGDRPDVRNMAVVITDGLANVRTRQTMREVRLARRAGIHVLPIGVAVGGLDEMRSMASDSVSGVFFAPSFNGLAAIRPNVVQYMLEGE